MTHPLALPRTTLERLGCVFDAKPSVGNVESYLRTLRGGHPMRKCRQKYKELGLNSNGQPYKVRRHPELEGLTGKAYRVAWRKLRKQQGTK